jgi:4-diphosphocytidyl-2-C-methyl-D-erythritol kinase
LVSAIDYSSVSTPFAFSLLDEKYGTNNIAPKGLEQIIDAIRNENTKDIASLLYNKFEDVIIPSIPNVQKIKDIMLQCGALGALMSGSGPSVFGIYENEESARLAVVSLQKLGFEAYYATSAEVSKVEFI